MGRVEGTEAEEIAERALGGATFSVEKFVESFPVLVEAAGGTARLRQMTLDLAIRGTLLPQPKDAGSAEHLLKSLLPRAVLPEAPTADSPFGIPAAWTWCFLGNLCTDVHYGYTASARAELRKTRLLRITDIQNDRVDWDSVPGCEIEQGKVSQYLLRHGDLLIARTGGTIGKTYLVQNPTVRAVFASYLIRAAPLSPEMSAYLKLFAGTGFYWRQLYAGSAGTGQPNVNATTLKALLLPLPPLAEQKRIVARVDQLMALIDQLEAKQNRKRDLGARFTQASLEALTTAESPQALTTAWTRLHSNWHVVADEPDRMDDLRRRIVRLGVRGMLSAGPDNSKWKTATVGDVVDCLDSMRKPVRKDLRGAENSPTRYPYFGANGQVGWIDSYLFDEPLVCVVEDETFIGRKKPFAYRIDGKTWVNNHAHVLRARSTITTDFLYYSLSFHPFDEVVSGTTGRKKLTKAELLQTPIIVPPVREQAESIGAITRLLKLCDALEAALRRREDRAAKLAEAVVQEMVA